MLDYSAWCATQTLPAQAKDSKGKKTKAAANTANIAVFAIKENFVEGSGRAGLFGDLQVTLRDMVERLDDAAKDKDVSAVLLQLRGAELGRGKVDELRAAIARVRKAGKKVYADRAIRHRARLPVGHAPATRSSCRRPAC